MPEDMIALVKAYFTAVDAKDLPGILATMTPDCRFTVETHGVVLDSRAEIEAMFARLWRHHRQVRHDLFTFVADPDLARIAAQFQVENRLSDGTLVHKSNCNFFRLRRGLFAEINVYMAGENTLRADDTPTID
ncbi:MAG: nuclear transport factor 2 family protein [Paracoccaceae bacterium]|nr:nuclear transport factor 2 family protein [Paracoccaceae bacterium]